MHLSRNSKKIPFEIAGLAPWSGPPPKCNRLLLVTDSTYPRHIFKSDFVDAYGRGVFLGQPRHCVCTNASRGLSATAEFLVFCVALLFHLQCFNGRVDETLFPFRSVVNLVNLVSIYLFSCSFPDLHHALCPLSAQAQHLVTALCARHHSLSQLVNLGDPALSREFYCVFCNNHCRAFVSVFLGRGNTTGIT